MKVVFAMTCEVRPLAPILCEPLGPEFVSGIAALQPTNP
jgi:predicted polyphosphate/ATP-dependent NAD kinase